MPFTVDSRNIFTLDPSHLPSLLLFISLAFLLSIYIYNTAFPIPPLPKPPATIYSLSFSPDHNFSKEIVQSLTLVANHGIENDAHAGTTVQHRSRLHITPPPVNLRQVHFLQNETLEKLDLRPGEIGENITTVGIDLLKLGKGTKLRFLDPQFVDGKGSSDERTAVADAQGRGMADAPTLTVRGLRNPCPQIQAHRDGLQEKFIERDEDRNIVARKAGVMSTVDVGGEVRVGMRIVVEEPEVWEKLECV